MSDTAAEICLHKVETVLNIELDDLRRQTYVDVLRYFGDDVLRRTAQGVIEEYDGVGFPRPAFFRKVARQFESLDDAERGGMPSVNDLVKTYRSERIPERMKLKSTLNEPTTFIRCAQELLWGAQENLTWTQEFDPDGESAQVLKLRISALIRVLEQEGAAPSPVGF